MACSFASETAAQPPGHALDFLNAGSGRYGRPAWAVWIARWNVRRRYARLLAAVFFVGALHAQAGQQPAAPATAQPQMTTLKSTFIPGDKAIFFDDFTDMTPDSAPLHFKVRGPAPELSEGGGIRQFSVSRVDFPQSDRSSQEFHV